MQRFTSGSRTTAFGSPPATTVSRFLKEALPHQDDPVVATVPMLALPISDRV
jgi:hypothetical protein